ncbi:5-deoxy-glucuronate isomerase [Sphingobacterium chuzhouense]|uniref:5-deoxy-glucuronate isomerase n=1 Tax=Sphingobacterium chuzhouense TaxID=1742264 RepID=A0ABR7XT22_9SPHI|nr:5-deoxy-glucuronate isomerase [Sphingobacterium chuzhouense]MBD1422325.1 5-deoxy-glucuronate isomerase [Sphingobacterium chuzhouense]
MELRKKYQAGPGRQQIVSLGEGGLKKSAFDLLELKAGETYTGDTENFESAFVILSGSCHISGDDFSFTDLGNRKDVFSGKPTTVYLPIRTGYQLTAVSDVELAICSAEADVRHLPRVIKPEEVKEVELGSGNWKRKAHFVIDQDVASQHLFLGETLLPPGKWAFPPHRHDKDDLPNEVDMEEVYHFRFQPKEGFGIQLGYTDDRSRDEAYLLRNKDTVLIPDGYHPVASSPVDALYMLWFMAGEKRLFIARPQDQYRWVAQYDHFLKSR